MFHFKEFTFKFNIALFLVYFTSSIQAQPPPEGFIRLVAPTNSSLETASQLWCDHFVSRTYLTANECSNSKTRNPFVTSTRPMLMTGIGRSGTTFIASLFKGAGLDIHHDAQSDCNHANICPGGDGAVSWPQAFSDQPFNVKNGERHCPLARYTWVPTTTSFDAVIHVIRDPLKTIDSRWNKGNIRTFVNPTTCNTVASLNNVFGNIDLATGYFGFSPITGASLRFTLQHWVLWNLFVEAQAIERYRIEDFTPDTARSICSKYLIGRQCPDISSFQQAPTSVNHDHTVHAPQSLVTWVSLSKLDLQYTTLAQKMTMRYGYHVQKKYLLKAAKNPHFHERCGFRKSDGRWKCNLIRRKH